MTATLSTAARSPGRPGGPERDDPDLQGARRAASLVLLRDGPQGLEVLLLQRGERTGDTRSGITVFPGGVLDPVDPTLAAQCDGPSDAWFSQRMGWPSGGLDYAVAAIRECFEETGVLLGRPAGAVRALQAERAALARAENPSLAFVQACERLGVRLALDELCYHSHWLSPPGFAQRFDTRFFLAALPEGQVPVADEGETRSLAWWRPGQALAPDAGLKLLPVTRRHLQQLAPFATVQQALAASAAQPVPARQMPRLGRDARGGRPVAPDEPAWAEIGRLDPRGRGDVACDLQPLRVVALSERVRRLTCDNGSVMTGPGTNSYLIGAPGSDELAVLDPGPLDHASEAHLQALLAAAAPARITRILVSHTHKDHSPAARRLQALTGARLIGRVAAHPDWQDTAFLPDQVPEDGERLWLGPGCTLRAVLTPGHASNHVCWLLEEEKLLFTGDHVMQGSTVVINPPDGDMAAYLGSLRQLMDLPLDWLAPGHGFLMAQPRQVLEGLVAHRLAREAKVLAVLRRLAAVAPQPLELLLPEVYGDVPAGRHGVAMRSLLAHLQHLADQGLACPGQAAGHWQARPTS